MSGCSQRPSMQPGRACTALILNGQLSSCRAYQVTWLRAGLRRLSQQRHSGMQAPRCPELKWSRHNFHTNFQTRQPWHLRLPASSHGEWLTVRRNVKIASGPKRRPRFPFHSFSSSSLSSLSLSSLFPSLSFSLSSSLALLSLFSLLPLSPLQLLLLSAPPARVSFHPPLSGFSFSFRLSLFGLCLSLPFSRRFLVAISLPIGQAAVAFITPSSASSGPQTRPLSRAPLRSPTPVLPVYSLLGPTRFFHQSPGNHELFGRRYPASQGKWSPYQ